MQRDEAHRCGASASGWWWRTRTGSKNTTHQCGTLCFGTDPRTSVLDPFCRAHDVENLFVVDASFFPSSAAVNPALTIVAQALRVADHITESPTCVTDDVSHGYGKDESADGVERRSLEPGRESGAREPSQPADCT